MTKKNSAPMMIAVVSLLGVAGVAGSLATARPEAVLADAVTAANLAQGAAAPAESSAPYAIDLVHSTALFRIKHQNVSWFWGRFNEFSGSFHFDAAKPEASSFNITIKSGSVDTNNKGRDDHVRSPELFSAEEFPEITFTSTRVEKTGENTFSVTGNLAFRGVTKEVTATVETTGAGPGRGGSQVAGIEGRLHIKRSDFGMTALLGGLSDDVHLVVGLQGKR